MAPAEQNPLGPSPGARRTIAFLDPNHYARHVGGAEIQMLLLARAFRDAGWAACYVTADIEDDYEEGGIRFIRPACAAGSPADHASVIEALRRTGADVIYQRGRKSYTALLPRITEATGIPSLFATSMDIDCRRLKETPRLLRSAIGNPRLLARLPATLRHDLATLKGVRCAAAVVVQSTRQQRAIRRSLGINAGIVRNIHPLAEISRPPDDVPPTVLWLANLKPWKRPAAFLRLVRRLAGIDCRFLMAGRLEDNETLAAQIHRLEREDPRFRYLGSVPFEESGRLFARASVFVSTSRRNEGMPNAFIQAWLAAVPVVSLSVDPDGLISHCGFGSLSHTERRLARDVARLLRNPGQRRAAGERARVHAATHFTAAANMPALLALAERLAAAAKRCT